MARVATAPARPAPTRAPARTPRPQRAEPARRPAAAPVSRGTAVLNAILHGRVWIALVFVLLSGIVFFNVDLLRMNREIAATAERTSTVKRENARLRTEFARLGSSERIQRVAAERGLVLPAPGEVRYLRSNPTADARRAAERIAAGEATGSRLGTPDTPPGPAQGQAASTTPAPQVATSETQPPE